MDHIIFSTHQPLILASASPRRQQFLRNLGIDFTVTTADVDETPFSRELPNDFARRMATDKAKKVAADNQASWVIGADTIVTLEDGTILGKPANQQEALTMLNHLNNATHRVMTGMCLFHFNKGIENTIVETTEVTFMDSPEALLKTYINTGEPLDKAGSYGIQGLGSFLVKEINGSCTNVIGLPVNRLISLLIINDIISPLP